MMCTILLSIFWAACTPVRGPLLRGSDLAAADPQFTGVPADSTIGYSPAPGSRRVVPEAEVLRLGVRFGKTVMPHELCFAYAMEELDRTTMLAAMELAVPGAEIEIVETMKAAVPQGRMMFGTASLPKTPRPDGTVIWRGYLEYGEGLKFAIWANVRMMMTAQRVIALKDLATGHEINALDVESRSVRSFPASEQLVERVGDAIGRRVKHSVRLGETLTAGVLQAGGQVVLRGDPVTVDVADGAAHLSLDTRAESAAAIGETVKLRNPKSGKVFEARVTAKGAASLLTAPQEMREKP